MPAVWQKGRIQMLNNYIVTYLKILVLKPFEQSPPKTLWLTNPTLCPLLVVENLRG